jgi:hypothetical protein
MKNLVTLQSLFEQALERVIKYNPNAIEELEKTHQLDVEFHLTSMPGYNKRVEIHIRYSEREYRPNRFSSHVFVCSSSPVYVLDELEEELKKQYGHGDPVLVMEIEQKE